MHKHTCIPKGCNALVKKKCKIDCSYIRCHINMNKIIYVFMQKRMKGFREERCNQPVIMQRGSQVDPRGNESS